MKIEILIDKKSTFPEKYLATIIGIKHVSQNISEISINNSHDLDCPSNGVYLDEEVLNAWLAAWRESSNFDLTLFITKSALSSASKTRDDLSTFSLFEAGDLEDDVINNVLSTFGNSFCSLLTEGEKQYLLSAEHPINGPDSSIRFKLPLQEVVMTIPGMNTDGEWEKKLSNFLSPKGFGIVSGCYGRLLAVVLPKKRKNVRSEILLAYEQMLKDFPSEKCRHTVIAHSYGTYGLFDVLQNEAITKFPDRIILVAPIVAKESKLWRKLIDKNVRVYLEIGERDFIVKLAFLLRLTFANLAGFAGWNGIDEGENLHIDMVENQEYEQMIKSADHNKPINLIHSGMEHSDYFSLSHFKNRWLPLIKYG